MENMIFVIEQKLPSLNEFISANRRNAYVGAKFKAQVENDICWYIRKAINEQKLHPCKEYPVVIFIQWCERTKKRDVDNIQSSQKFILDSLVKMGILQNDSRKYVSQVKHLVLDSDNNKDYVVVSIQPANDK